MELKLAQKKRRLKGQIPEIKQTLEILKYMQKKKVSAFLFVNMNKLGYVSRNSSSLTLWSLIFDLCCGIQSAFLSTYTNVMM